MRAARPAAGADETELPAREEERRINAVPEPIPAAHRLKKPNIRRKSCGLCHQKGHQLEDLDSLLNLAQGVEMPGTVPPVGTANQCF